MIIPVSEGFEDLVFHSKNVGILIDLHTVQDGKTHLGLLAGSCKGAAFFVYPDIVEKKPDVFPEIPQSIRTSGLSSAVDLTVRGLTGLGKGQARDH